MTTTAQQIVSRAQAMSALNTPLTSDSGVMLSRIRADQQAVFSGVFGQIGDRFQATASLTSTSGASGRTVDLSALTPPLGRVLTLTLASGARVRQVDVQDQDSKHAPRYYARGLTLVEVSNDWSTATGTVSLTLNYVTGPTDIDPTGSLTQTVSVPDSWTDLLVLPLAMAVANADPGRDPAEYARLDALYQARIAAFRVYLGSYAGDALHPVGTGVPK